MQINGHKFSFGILPETCKQANTNLIIFLSGNNRLTKYYEADNTWINFPANLIKNGNSIIRVGALIMQ